jgi:C4-dicarboxylate transporter DctM subunit
MLVLLVFGLMAVFIIINLPVAFALGVTSLAFLQLATNVPLTVVVQRLFLGVDSFTLLGVPLFIFVGVLMNYTNLSQKIVDFCMALVGHMKGGLAMVNVVTSMFFAGVSGTSMADTAAVGGVLIPAMIDKGYDRGFTGAVTAASSTIGIIIPPSVPMILYGVFVGLSVPTLFIAGLVPGVMIGLFMCLVAYFISVRKGYGADTNFSWKVLFKTFVISLPALVLPLIILGGIMGGVFTTTEAAGAAAAYIIAYGFTTREFTVMKIYKAAKETALLSGQVMIIIAVANLLAWVFAYARIPQMLVNPFLNLTTNPAVFLWIVSIILIIAGTFLHGTAMLVIVIPLFLPIAAKLGIHPMHFAMVVMMCWGIGQQTPPVASALYITCTLAKIDMWTLTKANMPFVGTLIAVLALVIHAPRLMVLALPNLLGML